MIKLPNRYTAVSAQQKASKMKAQAASVLCGISVAQVALYSVVFAAASVGGEGGAAVEKVMGTVLQWLRYVGGVVAVVGIAQFVLSWQRDDADGKSRAIKVIMAGAMLFGVGYLADSFIQTRDTSNDVLTHNQ